MLPKRAANIRAITALLAATPFIMAPTPLNMTVAGHPGSSVKQGREGTNDIFAFSHSLTRPFDPATGRFTGPKQHNPLSITKLIDKATPGFHKALAIGENLPTVTIDFYRIDPATRVETKYYVVTLTNAIIVDIETFMPTSFLPENEAYGHMEKISFIYERIEWDWLPDAIVESDTWIAQ